MLVAPVLAAMQGLIPTLGTTPAAPARGRPRAAARRARRAPRRARVRARRRGRAPRRVRRARRRRRRVPRHGAAPGAPRLLGRRDRVDPRVRALDAALDRARRARRAAGDARADPRRRRARPGCDAAAAEAPERFADSSQRLADGLFVEGAETLAPFLFDACRRRPSCCPTARGSCDAAPTARSTAPAPAHREAEALAEAIGVAGGPGAAAARRRARARVQLHLTEFAEGLDLGIAGWGTAQGNAAELAKRLGELAEPGLSDRRVGPRARLARAGARGARRRRAVEPVESPLANGFVFGAGQARGRHRGGPVRVAPPHPGRAAVHPAAHGLDRRRARARRLRRAPDPRRGALRGHHAPRARRRRARLPGARVRRRATSCSCPSDQVGMVAKYVGGDAPRLHRMGGSDWARATAKVKRAVKRHGRRARPPVHRAHVGARATRSGPTRPGSRSSRTRSRTRRRATRSRRSTRSRATWSCPSRWTG